MSSILTAFRLARNVPIMDVINAHGVKLRRSGREFVGPCPVCGGDDRFAVNPTKKTHDGKGVFNCRGCQTGGDVIELECFLGKCDRHTAARKLAGEPNKPNGKGGLAAAIKKAKAKAVPPKEAADNVVALPVAKAKAPKDEAAEKATRKETVATFYYTDAADTEVYRVERIEYRYLADDSPVLKSDGKREKTFRQSRPDPDRAGEWVYNLDGVTRVPYRLPELNEAIAAGHLVVVVEGERKVDELRAIGVDATTNACGSSYKWDAAFAEHLRGADVVLLPDNDEPGWRHMNDVGASLVGISARIRIVLLPDLPPKGDVVNWLAAGGTREQLDVLIEGAADWQPPTEEKPAVDEDADKAKAAAEEQKLIDELSRLTAVDYDRRRREAADQLGIRNSTLDSQVNARRTQREAEEPPPLFGHWVVEPWPEAVDTGELILAIIGRLRRHIIVTDEQALTVALWVMFAWVHEAAAVHSPILLVTSPEANSGKTQLVSVITHLVPRAMLTTGISEAALFRSIEKWTPTIIADEADVLLVDNEPLRAVINSGWTRGSGVLRCVGEKSEPHFFPTFCPKILGMKGKRLHDTTLSRAVVIEMARKRPGETVTHFRSIDDLGLAEVRRRALRWSLDNGEKLDGTEPDMPPGFDNRLGDNWELLLAIADFAGGEWPSKARAAAVRGSRGFSKCNRKKMLRVEKVQESQ